MLLVFLTYKLVKHYNSVFIRSGFRFTVWTCKQTSFPFQAVISDYQNSAVLYSYAVETWWKDKVVILRKK